MKSFSLTGFIALALIALLAPMGAWAALPYSPEWSWTAPTKNVDGSNVPATGSLALKEYRFYCAKAPASPSKTDGSIAIIPHPTLTWTTPVGTLTPGDWSCAVSAVNNAGEESALTNPLPFTIAVPAPEQPGVLQVR